MHLLDEQILIKGSLIFVRIGSMLFTMPFFGDSNVPIPIKIIITLSITFGLFSIVPEPVVGQNIRGVFDLFFVLLKEIILGISIGFLTSMIFDGIVMAASLVGYQMGFGTATLMMPGASSQMNSFTAFHRLLVLLLFLSLGFHKQFIYALSQSFHSIPLGGDFLYSTLTKSMIETSSKIFSTAIQLATPILVSVLFSISALGLLARTVPQLNVFTLSFPFSFFIGLTTYLVSIPFYPNWLKSFYFNRTTEIINLIRTIAT